MSGELEGRIAVVTGAARGMGRAVIDRFSEEGAIPVLVDVDGKALLDLAEDLREQDVEVMVQICDVSDADGVRMMADAVMEEYGRVDILVNCAGVMFPTPFMEMTVEEWDRVMAVNLRGTFLVTRMFYPHMVARKGGAIINFSSTAGITVSTLGGAHYTSSKHGVMGLTKALALEGGPHDVRVNAVCPGLIDTEMVRDTVDDDDIERYEGTFPIPRLGRPEEVAELVLFLASDRSGYITGTALNISGGDLL